MPAACKTCAAHKETIAALHMVIQAQNQSLKLLADRQAPAAAVTESVIPPALLKATGLEHGVEEAPDHMPRKWMTEDEEIVKALYEQEWIDEAEYEKRMAALQASNPPLSVVR